MNGPTGWFGASASNAASFSRVTREGDVEVLGEPRANTEPHHHHDATLHDEEDLVLLAEAPRRARLPRPCRTQPGTCAPGPRPPLRPDPGPIDPSRSSDRRAAASGRTCQTCSACMVRGAGPTMHGEHGVDRLPLSSAQQVPSFSVPDGLIDEAGSGARRDRLDDRARRRHDREATFVGDVLAREVATADLVQLGSARRTRVPFGTASWMPRGFTSARS